MNCPQVYVCALLINCICSHNMYNHVCSNMYVWFLPKRLQCSGDLTEFSHACMTALFRSKKTRVSVQGVKSLGGHFACLCRGFEYYEVKKNCYYFSKRKWKYFYTFNHFYSEKSSKRAK